MGLDMYVRDENDKEIAYWRKFNALHAWFVKNLQDGVDECQPSRRITRQDVEQIIYILKTVKKTPMAAKVLLPSTDGFFFGSTEYDRFFIQDVYESIEVFQRMLEIVDTQELHYQSSW